MSANLLDLQRRFKDSILQRSTTLHPVQAADASELAERLGIYAFAYRSRLGEALAHNFPMLAIHLGASEFNDLADRYNSDHPSMSASVRQVGSAFADWLIEHRPAKPWLAEFARLEWALGLAFDAPDERPLSTADLGTVEARDWPRIRFQFSHAVERLTLHTNAVELYDAATRAATPPAERTSESTEWLVWRESFTAHYRSMGRIEACAFDAIASGRTFGELCEQLLAYCDDDDVPSHAAACLKRWIEDQLILTLCVAST